MKTVFVGDRPSSKNLNQNVPFVGTKSYEVLIKWISNLNTQDFVLLNSYTDNDKTKIQNMIGNNIKWIALGNNASKILETLNIKHFKLPHPSPRNRLLNNKNYVDNQLIKCKNYINDIL